jgi:SAM-dependent methyltransferase
MFRRKSSAPSPAAPPTPAAPAADAGPTILDQYVRSAPSAQNAVDVFAGEWSSVLPAELGVTSGIVPLFEDPRITWLIDHVGGVDGFHVLELGPLEAGHTTMLHRAGASVVAIESNTRAYLKCLVVKELLDLPRCHFLLGDFVPYLQETDERFGLLLASGVLYHSPDPLGLLEAIARVADRVAIWTHYYEPTVVNADPGKLRMFIAEPEVVTWRDRQVTLHRRNYLESLEWTGFCGGPETSALWMERDDLLGVLGDLGFAHITLQYDDHTNPNGACIMLCAERVR